jgi:hypothetical protein
MSKGPQWERDLCRILSEWWSGGEHDDLFWRSSQSGGRATQRSKKGKRTTGHYGDIAATDPLGYPLTRVFALEAKKGYSKHTLHDFLDSYATAAQQQLESFIQQSHDAHIGSGSHSWILIHCRNRREPMFVYPQQIEGELSPVVKKNLRKILPRFSMHARIRFVHSYNTDKGKKAFRRTTKRMRLVSVPMYRWLEIVRPRDVRKLDRRIRKGTLCRN